MKLICERARLSGTVAIPGSKSHTIRAVAIAALAEGESRIEAPLESGDTLSALAAYEALGAGVEKRAGEWLVQGLAGVPRATRSEIDVGNSGTTLRIAMGSFALLREGQVVLTGDEQIQRRPAGPLAQSLTELGASVRSLKDTGCAPFEVAGCLRGGATSIEAVTSQYVTSLLVNTPLAEGNSHITVPVLNEAPYLLITLDWIGRQGVSVEHSGMAEFHVPGGQRYRPVNRRIPADFSSATFFLAAGALGENNVVSEGLDIEDTQGDRAVVDYLRQMGARVTLEGQGIRVKANGLSGCEIDLNATPDALPMMAALACFAQGTTRLVNVPQARLKETDRIAVMKQELERLGAKATELPDGLVIEESALHGAEVDGHGDHRVVMALAVAASMLKEPTVIHGYEAASITYPGFAEALSQLGARVHVTDT